MKTPKGMRVVIRLERIERNEYRPIIFLPDYPVSKPGMIVCYSHIDQHSEANMDYYRDTLPATPIECANLLHEYEHLGERTRLRVLRRMPARLSP